MHFGTIYAAVVIYELLRLTRWGIASNIRVIDLKTQRSEPIESLLASMTLGHGTRSNY